MNTSHLTLDERERIAYITGNTELADALAQADEVEPLNDCIEGLRDYVDELKSDARDESLEAWNNANGNADDYKQFFEACFEMLAGHYPCPSVSSDYDKSVIFDAIRKGEGMAE